MRAVCAALSLLAITWLSHPTMAQLTDIQAGRNFPTSTEALGAGRSENIDVGDIDNDGDPDVIVANGGNGAAQTTFSVWLNVAGRSVSSAMPFQCGPRQRGQSPAGQSAAGSNRIAKQIAAPRIVLFIVFPFRKDFPEITTKGRCFPVFL